MSEHLKKLPSWVQLKHILLKKKLAAVLIKEIFKFMSYDDFEDFETELLYYEKKRI